jgi:hypothetical protein
MNHVKVLMMFKVAKSYYEENYPSEPAWAKSISSKTFRNMRSKQFLSHYCCVVYANGFKEAIIEALFPTLRTAFKEFDLSALARMRSLKTVLKVFNNERKANSFLKGCKLIADEGFSVFKKRLRKEGVDMLEHLPGIGKITKYHLAKNIGLVDEAKPDIWLVRAANACSSTVEELVIFLSKKYKMSRHTVDVILWRYGAGKGLEL